MLAQPAQKIKPLDMITSCSSDRLEKGSASRYHSALHLTDLGHVYAACCNHLGKGESELPWNQDANVRTINADRDEQAVQVQACWQA